LRTEAVKPLARIALAAATAAVFVLWQDTFLYFLALVAMILKKLNELEIRPCHATSYTMFFNRPTGLPW
jgi:hypothetical protein